MHALRIGDDFPYVMVETRKKTDQFEAGMPSLMDPQEKGLPNEGVIAYRVQTRNPTSNDREGHKIPLFLITQTPLAVGESTVLDNEIHLKVTTETPKGFIVQTFEGPPPPPPQVDAEVPDVTGFNSQKTTSDLASGACADI